MDCNFCGNSCFCYIYALCHFCETHTQCEECGQLVCDDIVEVMTDTKSGETVIMCPDCASKYY